MEICRVKSGQITKRNIQTMKILSNLLPPLYNTLTSWITWMNLTFQSKRLLQWRLHKCTLKLIYNWHVSHTRNLKEISDWWYLLIAKCWFNTYVSCVLTVLVLNWYLLKIENWQFGKQWQNFSLNCGWVGVKSPKRCSENTNSMFMWHILPF